MKTQKLAAILGVAALALGACGGKDKSGGGKGDYTACLVSDSGGWDDKSFNQSAKEGLDKAVKDLGVKSKTAESKTDSDFTRNVEGMVGENCNLVMGVGFKLSDAISASAKDNADINYSLVDSTFKKNLDNERALVFNTHEAAYLAGYAAAANSKTGKVGTFGGVQLPTVTIFMDGFADGVARYNKDKGANVQLIGWDKASAAKNHAGTKIVGVDSDWYQSAPEYKDIVLTSVQKGIARAVYDTIKAGADGKFDKKPYVGTLKNGGVSLAPFHDFEGSLPAGLTGELDAIKKEIVEGKTVVTSKSAFDAKGGSGK